MEHQQQEAYTDSELLYLYRQGEEQALHLLLAQYEKRIRAIAYGYMKRNRLPKAEYEEMCQLAKIKLLQAVDTFRTDKEVSFAHFYGKIVRRACIDFVRQRRHGQLYMLSLQELEAQEGDQIYLAACQQADDADHAYLSERLQQQKAKLSKREAEILQLRLCGYTYGEIAAKLHLTRRQVEYALQKLRKE